MNDEFMQALYKIEKEKHLPKDVLLQAIQSALLSAYKKDYGTANNVSVDINANSGDIKVYAAKKVVEDVKNSAVEIDLYKARDIRPDVQLGDIINIEVTPKDFRRIAAKAARDIVLQKIHEVEKDIILDEYSEKEGEILTATVARLDRKNVYLDLGKIEGIMPMNETVPSEIYKVNDRLKVYILEAKKGGKSPNVIVSRSHPGLVKRLFELEIPEIHDGIVDIRAIAREAGHRSKVAVYSKYDKIDPIGSCIGPKGTRIQTIMNELRGERIDIVEWSLMPERFIANALSPAKVLEVILNEKEKSARVIVPKNQLSLAIGKEGQNARLAAKLTGWKIDIKTPDQQEVNETK
ncbi:transcription termination factor NusA [Mahella australiensis]|uniref:Transcription termination/antitermination protein NusA n=1 Tax=Mahella australiensis (strain DSM 15567 / CIP 107919 / 50-1 BON) TaxID=697281 RepID=F4A2Q1_MAHA5|nr:transcription termination factor NusA [Mahella australiensis]AEE96231.1 NusA antitermination factor [Mahella australiensis 50-1 BON]